MYGFECQQFQFFYQETAKGMASSKMNTIEDESDDLSHRCVCFEEFDNGERKPKFLSCHHTLCLTCAKVIQNVNYIYSQSQVIVLNFYFNK